VRRDLALLTDGADHWYTAAEASDEGFIDSVVAAIPIAAAFDLSRFRGIPAAAAKFSTKERPMGDQNKQSGTSNSPAVVNEAEVEARGREAEAQRRKDIADLGAGTFGQREGVAALLKTCQEDLACTVDVARQRLLAHLATDAGPLGGHYVATLEDEREKFLAAASAAIMARAAARDSKGATIRVDESNPYRGRRAVDLARICAQRAGVRVDGLDEMRVVGAAFTQSGSDFPILLENTMRKTLQQAYAVQPATWTRFCRVGSVSDFRAHPRYRLGSLSNLEQVAENAEYKNKQIPDGAKASITAITKGNIISVSRQMIINDDLGAFIDLAGMLGRAAKRTVEADVYVLLVLNSGMGPTMSDGKALFHVDHGNVAADGDLSVVVVDSMRSKMALQKDISGNDYLDLHPAVIVVPTASGGTARVINDAQYDPDTANKLQRPNMVRGLFRDIVDTPRLAGTRAYAFADPNEAPVIEVAFLNGEQEPFLELEEGFRIDGAQWKVRLDFGVAALDYRGAVTAKGAA